MMPKAKKACKVCMGRSKAKCLICGHKAPKEKKIYTREERRKDFLGGTFNKMRKYNMESTGLSAIYRGERIAVLCLMEEQSIIFINHERVTIQTSELTEVTKNDIDAEIYKEIGDPKTDGEYEPFRKLKKNEV